MNGENSFAALHIGTRNNDTAVKPSGSQQRRIQNVGPVCRGNENDTFVGFEAVHFHQQLIERLLALIVASAKTSAPMASNGIDLIYKDDTRRVFLSLFEQVAHARSADADEHFDEVRSTDREERDIRFACNRARKQRFSGAGGTDQHDAFRNAAAELLELLRLLQKVDNFLKFFLGFFDTCHIFKCDFLLMCRQQAGAALAER